MMMTTSLMTKQRQKLHRHCCFFKQHLKLSISLTILLCFLGFWIFQSQLLLLSSSSSNSTTTMNSSKTTRFSRRVSPTSFVDPPKIAFLYLTRRHLPLDFLWGSFFEGADASSYSIYIHSEPGFVFDESTTRSPIFFGRQLSNSIEVAWGQSSMIEAERLLLDAALDDPANQRFVLLSDSCVPLYNFSYIYHYVMESPRSFVDSFLDKKDERYNPKMSPAIKEDKWRKGSQWFTLIRKHAEVVVDDELVFSVFRKYCKRRPPVDDAKGKLNLASIISAIPRVESPFSMVCISEQLGGVIHPFYNMTLEILNKLQKPWKPMKLQKQHNCIPDEHYLQTLLTMMGLENELERRTLTYTLWNESASRMEGTGWHPVTFSYSAATPQRIQELKDISHVYYASEYRTEWCRTNSTAVPCFLFARKFSQGAAMRLLSERWI
ncbi:glycosyltransferase BC10 isoform X2 [Beta vulgaris subsp. vulgaris]|nr:glycosyltransferase BC10 isoform X2 [Beta vulgaris subsp. vulgaris]